MKATLSKTWIRRQIFITVFLVGLGLWFFYDGKIGFPNKNERFVAHQKFGDNSTDWEKYAKSRGWPKRPPERLYKQADIVVQYILGAFSVLGGFAALGLLFRSKGRTVSSEGNAYYAENGQRVPFDAVVSIDKRKWDSKGIAVLSFKDGARTAKAIVDDYKFAGADQILLEVEAALEKRSAAQH